MSTSIQLEKDYITMGQFLKYADIVSSGGEVKHFLAASQIRVNGTAENRRGRKLYPGDQIQIQGHGEFQLVSQQKGTSQ